MAYWPMQDGSNFIVVIDLMTFRAMLKEAHAGKDPEQVYLDYLEGSPDTKESHSDSSIELGES